MVTSRLAQQIVAIELPILLAIAPALLFPTPRRLLVLIVVPFLWLSARRAGYRPLPRTPLDSALWLMIVMVGVSLWVTVDVRFSLGKVSGVVLGMLLFWAVTRWLTSSRRLQAVAGALLLTGGGLAVVGLLGGSASNLLWLSRWIPGIKESFNGNAVAGCLVLIVPLQVALLAGGPQYWFSPESRHRWASFCCTFIQASFLILTAATILTTQSRGALLGLAFAAAAFSYWYSRHTRFLTTSVGITIVVLAMVFHDFVPSDLGTPPPSGRGLAYSISLRLYLWSAALELIVARPLTGVGMNVFRTLVTVPAAFQTIPDYDVAHAHNHLLQAALDLGIPGLVAYLSLWVITATLLSKVYRHSTGFNRKLAGGLGAGLIAHFVFGLTDAIPLGSKVGVLFWLVLALCVGLHQVFQRNQPVTPAR